MTSQIQTAMSEKIRHSAPIFLNSTVYQAKLNKLFSLPGSYLQRSPTTGGICDVPSNPPEVQVYQIFKSKIKLENAASQIDRFYSAILQEIYKQVNRWHCKTFEKQVVEKFLTLPSKSFHLLLFFIHQTSCHPHEKHNEIENIPKGTKTKRNEKNKKESDKYKKKIHEPKVLNIGWI